MKIVFILIFIIHSNLWGTETNSFRVLKNFSVVPNCVFMFSHDWDNICSEMLSIKNYGQIRKIYMTVYSQKESGKIGIILNNNKIELGKLNFTGEKLFIYTNSCCTYNYLVLDGFYIQRLDTFVNPTITTYIEKVVIEYDMPFGYSNICRSETKLFFDKYIRNKEIN